MPANQKLSTKTLSQSILFERVKLQLKPNETLVNKIAELLEISDDSAYRRIRGETLLNIDELRTLCIEFKFSMDEILIGDNKGMFFRYRSVRRSGLDFKVYYSELADTLEKLSNSSNPNLLYAAWDVPIFHYFNFPEVMLFKTFFWRKSVWNDPSLVDVDFRVDSLMETHGKSILNDGNRILNAYINIPSVEIWHDWTLESTLKQIEFAVESGFFKKKEDYYLLFEQLFQLVEHVADQAKSSYKFKYGQKPEKKAENYEVYLNEVFFLNNTIVAEADNYKQVYVIHESVNYLETANPTFCEETSAWMHVQKNKSILLTNSSERLRNKFFEKQNKKIIKMMKKLEIE